jgi:hypothetical protein
LIAAYVGFTSNGRERKPKTMALWAHLENITRGAIATVALKHVLRFRRTLVANRAARAAAGKGNFHKVTVLSVGVGEDWNCRNPVGLMTLARTAPQGSSFLATLG